MNPTKFSQEQIGIMFFRFFFEAKRKAWADKAYAAGKWTSKEVIGFMLISTERIMTFSQGTLFCVEGRSLLCLV